MPLNVNPLFKEMINSHEGKGMFRICFSKTYMHIKPVIVAQQGFFFFPPFNFFPGFINVKMSHSKFKLIP